MQNSINDFRLKALRDTARKILPSGYWQNEEEHVHLTFDDGPTPETTPALVKMLSERNIKATFFFTGENARKHRDLVAMAADHGHEVGNHSYSHQFCYVENLEKFSRGIDLTNKIIEESTGIKPTVYRPPFGIIDQKRADLIHSRDMRLVYWGALAEDWKAIGDDEIVRRINKQMEPGTIIVLHEMARIKTQCLNATVRIIDQALEDGYRFDPICK